MGRPAPSAVAQRPSPGAMMEGVGPPASAHVLGREQAVMTPRRGYGRPGPEGFLEEVAQSWRLRWPRRLATRTVCPARQRAGPEASSSRAAAPPRACARGSGNVGPAWLPLLCPDRWQGRGEAGRPPLPSASGPGDTQNPAAAHVPAGSAALPVLHQPDTRNTEMYRIQLSNPGASARPLKGNLSVIKITHKF